MHELHKISKLSDILKFIIFAIPRVNSYKALVMKRALVLIFRNSQELEERSERDWGKCAHSAACLWLGVTRILAERNEECRLGFWHLLERKTQVQVAL